jgi:hypothetical protein
MKKWCEFFGDQGGFRTEGPGLGVERGVLRPRGFEDRGGQRAAASPVDEPDKRLLENRFRTPDPKITFGSMPVGGVNAFFVRCTENHAEDGLDFTPGQPIVARRSGRAWSTNKVDKRPRFYFTLQS